MCVYTYFSTTHTGMLYVTIKKKITTKRSFITQAKNPNKLSPNTTYYYHIHIIITFITSHTS
jgi:hypothetical protein